MNVREVPRLGDSQYQSSIRVEFRRILLSLFGMVVIALPVAGQPATKVAPVQNERLRQELLAMRSEDQTTRIESLRALKKLGVDLGDPGQHKDPKVQEILALEIKKGSEIDKKHRNRLAEIIDEYGWPGSTLVGHDGANAAWLIAQHADADVAFQKRCLQLMEAAPKSEVELSNVAYLTDRVLVNEQQPQRYGTQMGENFKPQPIEDSENVDQRRAQVGLPPLAQYLQTAKEQYEKIAAGEDRVPETSE